VQHARDGVDLLVAELAVGDVAEGEIDEREDVQGGRVPASSRPRIPQAVRPPSHRADDGGAQMRAAQ